MTTKNIRFLLSEIEIYYDGDEFVDVGKQGREPYGKEYVSDKSKFDNIVEAKLEYPRSGTPQVASSKMMDLPSRRAVKLDVTDFWESGLFKEDVDSETRFTLTVSDRDSVSRIGRWFRKILSAMFQTAVGSKIKGITNLFQGAVASDLQSRLVKGVKGDSEDSMVTALCASKPIHIELKPNGVEAYWLDKGTRRSVLEGNVMTIDLLSKGTIRKTVGYKTQAGSNIKRPVKKTQFKKNQKLGTAKILLIGA